jgi:hypothetical protein
MAALSKSQLVPLLDSSGVPPDVSLGCSSELEQAPKASTMRIGSKALIHLLRDLAWFIIFTFPLNRQHANDQHVFQNNLMQTL